MSSEVWVPYLLGWILHNNWLLGVGTACWLFWLGPGTPFMVICIMATIAIKGIFNKKTITAQEACQGEDDGNSLR